MPPPLPARTVLQTLFAVASRGRTGLLLVERGDTVARLELEQGFVHAMSNVGERRPSGEETLRRLLAALDDEARAHFQERPTDSPLLGFRVPAFHPARTVRAHVEAHPFPARDLGGALLRLQLTPHTSCLDGDEQPVVALLALGPRRRSELAALVPRPRLERLLRFLEVVGALVVEDAAIAQAFALLGLAESAGTEEIKRAYRRLAQDAHPDRHPDASEAERRALEARFTALTDAYRRLLP